MAAVGATVAANNSTAGSGTFTIQPGSGQEWIIHNLYFSGSCNIQKTDGTVVVTFAQPTTQGSMQNIQIHLTNGEYLLMVDTSGTTNKMAYDGIETV